MFFRLVFESLNVSIRCNFAYITVGILFIMIINRMQFLRDYMITEIKKKKKTNNLSKPQKSCEYITDALRK